MPATPAQIAANRLNAQRSSGPTTVEGKETSRRNALKHGPTGAGIVLPNEDAAEVERRFAAFQDELKPSGEVGKALVRHAALMSVRMDRSAEQEAAALSDRVRQAEADFDAPEGVREEEAARLRAEAGRRAMFDPSREASLARRYEAAAERGFFRALKELRLIEKQAKAADPVVQVETYRKELGSFLAHKQMDAEFDAMYAAFEAEDAGKAAPPTSRRPAADPTARFVAAVDAFELPFAIGRSR